jgi:riboflavin synthase
MFTGIIESTGIVKQIEKEGSNHHIWIKAPFTNELKIDQSVAHNGVCLTVVDFRDDLYKVTAIKETLERSNLGQLKVGDDVNLERCMKAGSRLDGHIVQGHVDTIGKISAIKEEEGSWLFTFNYTPAAGHVVVEKGSITVNGTSLTCFGVAEDEFSVAIIPYTFEHTNFNRLAKGDSVNLEFDIIGKYVQRLLSPYEK